MSTSPKDAQDDGVDNKSLDELDANHTADDAEAGEHLDLPAMPRPAINHRREC